MSAYPAKPADRDRWIVNQRGPRESVSAERPYAFTVEQERFANGELGPVAVIFLTNRECPWRCAMCDLWRHTLTESVPVGAIPRQIEYALARLPAARQIKLYNSGSFFDPRAIPASDYADIAALVSGFERVIVECHPSLVSSRCAEFQQLIGTQLEVAMGLETAHPVALEKLNKRMTVQQFERAAARLSADDIALRSFILVQPPFVPRDESFTWVCRSMDVALRCGATALTLIATRAGNGTVEQLLAAGEFDAPGIADVEDALERGLQQATARARIAQGAPARVFADVWEIDRVLRCAVCSGARIDRLRQINDTQHEVARVQCAACGGKA